MYVYIKHIVRFYINSAKGVIVMERKMNIYISIIICKVCFKNGNSSNKTLYYSSLRPHGL